MNAFVVTDVAGGSALGCLFAGAGYETVVETKSVAGDQLWKELVCCEIEDRLWEERTEGRKDQPMKEKRADIVDVVQYLQRLEENSREDGVWDELQSNKVAKDIMQATAWMRICVHNITRLPSLEATGEERKKNLETHPHNQTPQWTPPHPQNTATKNQKGTKTYR